MLSNQKHGIIPYVGGCIRGVSSRAKSRDPLLSKSMNDYYVYILTNERDTRFYIGVTNNLTRRVYEHKNELIDGFTKQYHIHKLVYFEMCHDVEDAIRREKQLKSWTHVKKIALIERMNPRWKDFGEEI